jgi:hypothetical protein
MKTSKKPMVKEESQYESLRKDKNAVKRCISSGATSRVG